MKKISMLFCAGVLMSALGAAVVACNDEPNGQGQKPNENEIKPVALAGEVGNQLTAFFEENVNRIAQSIFEEDGRLPFIDTCVMINSVDEFPKADWGGTPFEFQYPDINFDAYTLVIGQWVGGPSLYIWSQSLVVEQNVATMNLIIGQKEGLFDQNVYPMPFWRLYPKITAEAIHTNVDYKE
jgi:hypothetical protein